MNMPLTQSKETHAHLVRHQCALSEERDGLAKLPPNASWHVRVCRRFRKLLCPSPDFSISRRNFRNTSQIYAEARRHARSEFFYIIHPYSHVAFYRELLFLIIGTWKIVAAPLFVTLTWISLNLPNMPNREHISIDYIELSIFVVGVIWVITSFFAGYKERKGNLSIQLNHLKIVKRYITSYFLVDLMMILPYVERAHIWPWMYWIHLSVILRCPTIIGFLKRFLKDLRVPQEMIIFIILLTLSFLFNHYFACIFYLAPLMARFGEQRLWVVDVDLHPSQSIGVIYCGCLSMVQMHFWGLGESTITSMNLMEQLVLTVIMIFGRLWSLFVIAAILRVFTISSLSESKYEQYLKQLQTFIVHNNMPKEMEARLLKYYENTFQLHFFNEKSIFNAMSHYLRQELTLFRAKNVINKAAVFKYFPRSMVAAIIEKSKILVFLNNDYVVKAGDEITHVYFISWGTIAVFNQDKFELIHLSDGDELGMRGVTTPRECFYRFTYVSIETTEIYSISVKDFRAIVYTKSDVLKFFQKKTEERTMLWRKIESVATAQGVDLLSELRQEKLLERPRIRTRHFEE